MRRPYSKGPPIQRVLEYIEIDPATGCWEWQMAKRSNGYGVLRVDGRTVSAHQIAYQELVGPVPEGLELDHLCRNPGCVNPAHLEAVTHAENMRRAPHVIDQMNRTHCPHGHPYDEKNTRWRGNKRCCRTCDSSGGRGRRPKAA